MSDGFIGPVNRQGVLNQVVGADRQKVKVFQKQLQAQGRSRYLNHCANLDRAVNDALAIEHGAGLVDVRQRLADLPGVRQHGNEQMHLTMGRSTQNGTQLGEEHGRVRQAPADGAQTQRGVEVGVVSHRVVQRLVGPDIDRSDSDRQALHAFHGSFVGLVLLFLVRQAALAPHE